jgi:2',3'-cyclic-nucleotide 2'-phosphodiesterase (5'-nucleotidase family)
LVKENRETDAEKMAEQIELKVIGTYATGVFDESAAEIPAYDPETQRLFVVNANSATVDVLDLSDPTNPTLITSIELSNFGGVANSVAVKNGLVAVAVENNDKQANGQVIFFNANSEDFTTPAKAVDVGALPDMLTFTPDGQKVLVANEGEPSDDYSNDPEGSVSIIDLAGGVDNASVTNADFTAFNTEIDALKEAGVRIFGPDATVAQDLEPEYITVSPDSQTAWVVLQENNALGVIDLATGIVTDILPLGFKDRSAEGNGLDASDEDGEINITNWPVLGMYLPDAIDTFQAGDQTYLISANEGDSRDYDGFSEEARIEDLFLDPEAFPNADELQTSEALGRLKVTKTLGISDATVFIAELDGTQEVEANDSEATATAKLQLNDAGDVLSYSLTVTGLDFGVLAGGDPQTEDTGDDVTLFHFHNAPRGENGDVVFDILNNDEDLSITIDDDGSAKIVGNWEEAESGDVPLSSFVDELRNAEADDEVNLYFNLHTNDFPGGEIRGQLISTVAYDELYSFGGRSFSIWDSNGNLVFDSGDDFEQIIAEQLPEQFNFDGDNDSFDSRSDDKGPEPEGVTVGVIDEIPYAFIGLERIGGIMVYNISDPTAPEFVQYINNRDFNGDPEAGTAGDISPEGLTFIAAEDSANGKPLLAVANEVSGTTTIYEIDTPETAFTLQILHASDLEGGVDAIDNAPNFASIIDFLEDEFDNSITLSAGDNYLSGPFFSAAGDSSIAPTLQSVYEQLFGLEAGTLSSITEGVGRVDISIMNLIGFDASALGNHEFDLGTRTIKDIIDAAIADSDEDGQLDEISWLGSQFPYLSSNLDFSNDGNLSGIFTSEILANTAFQSTPDDLVAAAAAPKIAPATIIERGEEKIGVVGATTPLLESISSPGDTQVIGFGTNDMEELAGILQPVIDELIEQGINKIILVSHLQQIQLEEELVPLLKGVDIAIAGGSDTLLADANDILRSGDEAAGDYPIVTTNADGDPALIVSTDGEYSYVGRLVVDFDANGVVIPDSVAEDVSGAFATTDEVVENLWGSVDNAFADGTKGDLVRQLTDAVDEIVTTKDSEIFGKTDVFLEGRRNEVRTQETNLGNLTADANLAAAQEIDPTVTVSIKNGGGIRAEIGTIDGTTGEELPTEANPKSGKETGEVSQLDIENSLRFNNLLSLVTVTAEELKQILEHGVAASAEGATPGQFPQVGGLAFSFDIEFPAIAFDGEGNVTTDGERVRSLAIVDENGNITDTIVENGEIVGDPNRTIRLVTLNFLADGGDGYPFPQFGEDVIATEIGEQQAFGDFLADDFAETPFNVSDTEVEFDERIQNLDFREDTVLPTPNELVFGTTGNDTLEAGITPNFDGSEDLVFTGSGEDLVDFNTANTNSRAYTGTGADELFASTGDRLFGGEGDDTFDAAAGSGNNRLYGGAGNDTFFLGTNDVLVGGDGNDKFFVGSGGENRISGGAGADEFWLANVESPATANTIVDLEIDTDIIGISLEGVSSIDNLGFRQEGDNAIVSFEDDDLGIFLGIQATDLQASANFVFA